LEKRFLIEIADMSNTKINAFLYSLFPVLLLSCFNNGSSSKGDETAIRSVLTRQITAWNKGDIDEFMEGYWKSDSILFIGSKISHGWTETLSRYKKSYPNKAAMGILDFEILRVDRISPNCFLITGTYLLTREFDKPTGIFTLLFQKKNGKWVIVYDHTS
jgi:hypothetical protein